jgi:hypothetical protein
VVSLITYECKKHFFKKAILIALIIFSAMNVVRIYGVYNNESALASESKWSETYFTVYKEFSGEMTAEKIDKLLSVFRPLEQKVADQTATTDMNVPGTYTGNYYSDYHLLNLYYVQPMEYAFMYRNTADGIAAAAKENAAFYADVGNIYEARRNTAIADLFSGREISEFYYTEMYQHLVQYDFSVLLVLLICIFGIASVFSTEKETEMEFILLTARRGGYSTIFAKIAACVFYATAVCAWFWLLDFAAFSLAFGTWEGAGIPVYALRDFLGSPIGVPLGAYALVSMALKTMGVIALCMGFMLIAHRFKNALLPFIFNCLAAIGLIFHEEMFLGSSKILLKVLNPFVLIMNRELFHKTEFVNIFGFPVLSYVCALAFGAFWILLFGALLIYLYPKNEMRLSRTPQKGGFRLCKS